MNMALYSPEDVVILLGGVYQIDGLHEGSFLSISKDEQQYKTFVSTDGLVSRLHVDHPIHTVRITTSSVADINSVLTTLSGTDNKLYGVIIPIFIKDTNGSTLFFAPDCWIEAVPESIFGENVEARQWVIKAANASSVIGGNGGGLSTTGALTGVIGSKFLEYV